MASRKWYAGSFLEESTISKAGLLSLFAVPGSCCALERHIEHSHEIFLCDVAVLVLVYALQYLHNLSLLHVLALMGTL